MIAPPLTPAEAADAVDALWDRIEALVGNISQDDWHRPTPCEGWDVFDLVGHIAGLTTMFAGVPQPDPPAGWSAPEGLGPIDTFTAAAAAARHGRAPEVQVAELGEARHVWTAVLRGMPDLDGDTIGPTGPMTQAAFVAVRLFDLWQHLWDLGTALDRPIDLTDDSVAAVQAHAYVAERLPWLYGKRAGAPEGAAVTVRLRAPLDSDATVAVTGGRAGWVEGPAADVLHGPAAAFALLMSGRLDEHGARAVGLRADGPEARRLLAARLF